MAEIPDFESIARKLVESFGHDLTPTKKMRTMRAQVSLKHSAKCGTRRFFIKRRL